MSQLSTTPLRPVRVRFGSTRAIGALMLREISTTYGRSPGGYLWAFLEPAAGITLLTAIFSIGFRTPPLGVSFALFYATGILPFMMYLELSNKLSLTLNFSRALLAYPRVTFADAILARFLLNLFTQLIVNGIVFAFILTFYKTNVTLDGLLIAKAYVMVAILGLGFGVVNCFFVTAFPIWQSIWAVMNRPMFIISGVFFTYESIPQPYSEYLWYNPLVHVVGMMRSGFYSFYDASYVSVLYPCAVGGALTAVGLFLLHRYHRDILDK